MKALSNKVMDKLIATTERPCISIYLAGHRGEGKPGVKQDQIKLKNFIKEARTKLLALGTDQAQSEALLAPLQAVLADDGFWMEQTEGIALFSAAGFFHSQRLPYNFDGQDLVVVADRFLLKPLLPFLCNQQEFFVLALDQHAVRLLHVENHHASEVPLPRRVPHNIATTLQYEEREQQQHFMSSRPERGNERGLNANFDATYHGGEADPKEEIVRYFKEIDHGLREIFNHLQSPLILAGVEYEIGLYRQHNTYPHLLAECIEGGARMLSDAELHQRGWQLVAPLIVQARAADAERFHELESKNRGSSELSEVVRAAYQGRVDTLFLATDIQRWGRYNPDDDTFVEHNEPQPGDIDLIDFAAHETLAKGGKLWPVKLAEMPAASPVAAIFRFVNIATAGGGTKSK